MKSVLLLVMSLVVGTEGHNLTIEQQYSVPEWAQRLLQKSDFERSYLPDAYLNPFCHRGDFDGEGKPISLCLFDRNPPIRLALRSFIKERPSTTSSAQDTRSGKAAMTSVG
jgi:hypothetical protein